MAAADLLCGNDPGERHAGCLVGVSDVVGGVGVEPAEARVVRRHVGRAEVGDPAPVCREPCQRGLEPGAVASGQVSLDEVARHTFTIRCGLCAINHAKPWIYPCGFAAIRAASSVRELTPSLR